LPFSSVLLSPQFQHSPNTVAAVTGVVAAAVDSTVAAVVGISTAVPAADILAVAV
jgi:hypothetical protein